VQPPMYSRHEFTVRPRGGRGFYSAHERTKGDRTNRTARGRPGGCQVILEDTPLNKGVLKFDSGLRKAETRY
jgi:hypothetical protein